MNRKKFMLIFVSSLLFFFMIFFYGYNEYNSNIDKIDKDHDNATILKEKDIISPNTKIEEKILYKSCNHSKTKTLKISADIVNMDEDDFKIFLYENYPNKKLVSFNRNLIKLYEEKDILCQNHYIVGEYNGYVAIYGIDDKGEKFIDKVFTDNPINILKPIDQEKLKSGILVNSEEEMLDILENFLS